MSSERDLKAEEYEVQIEEIFGQGFANICDTCFKSGWDQCLQSEEVNKLREEILELNDRSILYSEIKEKLLDDVEFLKKEIRIMREALEFYSKEENQVGSICGPTGPWDYSAVDIDRGKIAREALAAVGVNTEGLEKVK